LIKLVAEAGIYQWQHEIHGNMYQATCYGSHFYTHCDW